MGEATDRDGHSGKGSLEGPYAGGGLRLAFILNDRAKVQYREFAQVEGIEAGDRLVLRNLNNGEEAVGRVDERGFFRMSVPSDALNATDRRSLIGLEGDAAGQGSAEDNTLLGDALELTVHVGETDAIRAVVDTFGQEVEFQGTIYPADTTLVALQEGLGKKRNSRIFDGSWVSHRTHSPGLTPGYGRRTPSSSHSTWTTIRTSLAGTPASS